MLNAQQLAVEVLVDGGSTRDAAMNALLSDPSSVERLAPQIEAKRASLEEASEAAGRAVYEASPAGRQEKAEAVFQARIDRAQQAEYARALLESEGIDARRFSDDDALWASGSEPKPGHLMNHTERDEALESLASKWNHLPDPERRAAAKELREDPDLVASYAARTYGNGGASS